MNRYEESRIALATVANSVGRLPRFGEGNKLPPMPQRRVRVLRANFYAAGLVPDVGQVISIGADLAADLIARGLAEHAP